MSTEHPSAKQIDRSLTELDRSISIARWLVIGWMVVTAIVYVIWMWLGKGWADTSKGGTLGDFFGGVLNPAISLAAFYWLTKAVRLQKEELADTKDALEDSAKSQAMSVRIAALSALIEAYTADIGNRRNHLAFLLNQRSARPVGKVYSLRGTALTEDTLRKLLRDLNDGINHRTHRRSLLVSELRTILGNAREDGGVTEFSDTRDYLDDVVPFEPDDHEDILREDPPATS